MSDAPKHDIVNNHDTGAAGELKVRGYLGDEPRPNGTYRDGADGYFVAASDGRHVPIRVASGEVYVEGELVPRGAAWIDAAGGGSVENGADAETDEPTDEPTEESPTEGEEQ